MSAWLQNPGWLLIAAGLLLPLLPLRLRQALLILTPLAAMTWLLQIPQPTLLSAELLGYTLSPLRVDGLSFVFALIFLVATLLAGLFMLHLRSRLEPASALVYAGAAICATLAGDLLSLFVYWEITALASALIILANGPQTHRIMLRYLIIQVSSGLLLMAGAVLYMQTTGSTMFNHIGLAAPGGWLIFLAFGIKAAFPLLHNWLSDTYPAASATGTVFLSAFTTKMAIYALARGYAGTEILLPIGAIMTLFPITYALLANDLRRMLAYSLNIQLGFMVVGVGIGTELALNGTAAHAVAHVLYKALLFMCLGAVLFRVGTVRTSDLGGLYRSMPFTTACCIIGAASISAVPLFSGFVSKSLILGATAYQGAWLIWLCLLFASACVLLYCGIRLPYFAFFGPDSGLRCQDAPLNMKLAMGLTALASIGIGCAPPLLYWLLPYAVNYEPYTAGHVLSQMQLLLFSALAFVLLLRSGLYPQPQPGTLLDFDWTYRRLLPAGVQFTQAFWLNIEQRINRLGAGFIDPVLARLAALQPTDAVWGTGAMASAVVLILGVYLLLFYTVS